jgi:hypothetical protein
MPNPLPDNPANVDVATLQAWIDDPATRQDGRMANSASTGLIGT